jgi:hypothetical protein
VLLVLFVIWMRAYGFFILVDFGEFFGNGIEAIPFSLNRLG